MSRVSLVLAVLAATAGYSESSYGYNSYIPYGAFESSGLFQVYYPNMVPGFQNRLYAYLPQLGQFNCYDYWCKSPFTSQHYCCSAPIGPEFAGVGPNQPFGAFGGFNQFNPNPFGSGINPFSTYGSSLSLYNPLSQHGATYQGPFQQIGNFLSATNNYRPSAGPYNAYGNSFSPFNPYGYSRFIRDAKNSKSGERKVVKRNKRFE